ncbi:hypothetical protein [Billgrantia gudaonensis]|uniref:Uncharacterized protein n=1 Tax=Billgrantia gudaonensis TaxID=376427 RepID=A0A1G8MNT3_9GAMM|nr:hypothetical protein [Halomonas gudaonensis]SDI69517.1 hypothetical protein SAMN04487954_10164 [Halomonas gudaonensis]
MATVVDLLQAIEKLHSHASQAIEESFRLIMEGGSLNESVRAKLSHTLALVDQLEISPPTIWAADTNERIDADDLSGECFDDSPWRLVLGKTPIAKLLQAREDETTLVFFSVDGFHQWLKAWDPFLHPTGNIPDLANPTTIRVNGLSQGVGGPLLWVLPAEGLPPQNDDVALPESAQVHGLIHTNATKALRVCPNIYALTWGNLGSPEVAPLVTLSAGVLSACLVQELRCVDGSYEATLQGTKRISLPLFDANQELDSDTLQRLIEAVSWVYKERPETRLGLLMDRLSIDIERDQSLLSGMEDHIEAALHQARDSYAFVILDRKDAYHKEVRELMKDMKAQADLYAAKVRDLVNTLTRDALGMLVFIAFSFIARFDRQNFKALLESNELALLVKVLAGFLVLSFTFQAIAHLRDVTLASKESETWLDVLQHYSSQDDKQNRFLEPIRKRRETFYVALFIAAVAYGLLAWATWNLPGLISSLLGVDSSTVAVPKS